MKRYEALYECLQRAIINDESLSWVGYHDILRSMDTQYINMIKNEYGIDNTATLVNSHADTFALYYTLYLILKYKDI
jgi:hypothetical protein